MPAQATVDPDIDQIGVYFDLDADQTSLDITGSLDFTAIFSAYVIITNPSASAVTGIQFSHCEESVGVSGAAFNLSAIDWYGGYSDTLDYFSWCEDGRRLIFYGPLPFVGSNVPVLRLEYTVWVGEPVLEFFLGPFHAQYEPVDYPAYRDADGVYHRLGISSGDASLPVAVVNGDSDVVSTIDSTLGSVKALYR